MKTVSVVIAKSVQLGLYGGQNDLYSIHSRGHGLHIGFDRWCDLSR